MVRSEESGGGGGAVEERGGLAEDEAGVGVSGEAGLDGLDVEEARVGARLRV